MSILVNLLGLAVGIAILVKSADIFVDGSAALAKRCGMSSLLIGMIIIGFGTSMPEMLVSVLAAMEGSPSIALGNAYGSNTANIGLILGLTALLAPISVASGILKRELPMLIGITLVCLLLLLSGSISRLDSIIMLVLFVGFLINNIVCESRKQKQCDNAACDAEETDEPTKPMSVAKMLLMIGGGLALLVGSSRLLVVCAVKIAAALGISDLIIGLTVVAVGTSLPELASSIAAIKKNEHDLALGNIVGSNFFNTLAVVGLAGVIKPMDDEIGRAAARAVLVRDYPVVLGMTIALLLFCIPWKRGERGIINRAEGLLMLLAYVAYIGYLVYVAKA